MGDLINLLKSKTYQIKEEILCNYKKLDITDSEFIILIYLINQDSNIYNPKKISNDLGLKLNEVLELINNLSEKKFLEIRLEKKDKIRNEIIDLNMFYEKIVLSLENQEEDVDTNVFSLFEKEFGRTLSPMEYEIIKGWFDSGYSEELVLLALKEATYNGVSNLRYIDKIIYEWGKKGIKNKEDIEKNRKQFKSNTKRNTELFDYDWLNDEASN